MIDDLNRNACALIACILNPKLTKYKSLIRMGIKEFSPVKNVNENKNMVVQNE